MLHLDGFVRMSPVMHCVHFAMPRHPASTSHNRPLLCTCRLITGALPRAARADCAVQQQQQLEHGGDKFHRNLPSYKLCGLCDHTRPGHHNPAHRSRGKQNHCLKQWGWQPDQRHQRRWCSYFARVQWRRCNQHASWLHPGQSDHWPPLACTSRGTVL